jgi:hypothetical protein
MLKRKRQSKKKLRGQARKEDALRWLQLRRQQPEDYVEAYAKRYGISEQIARNELIEIGYYDEILIRDYEKEGVKWEYMVEPLSGEMYVVPEGIEQHELYFYHPFF